MGELPVEQLKTPFSKRVGYVCAFGMGLAKEFMPHLKITEIKESSRFECSHAGARVGQSRQKKVDKRRYYCIL